MEYFVLNSELIDALTAKGAWPQHDELRDFRTKVLKRRGFRGSRYTRVRGGFASDDRDFLLDILLCIRNYSGTGASHLGIDWKKQDESELSTLFIRTVGPGYQPVSRTDSDLIAKGPRDSAVELIQLRSSSIANLRMNASDVHKASRLWARSVSHDVLKEHTNDRDAEATAIEEFCFQSISQFEDFLLGLIATNPNSVLFRQSDNESGFLLIAFPLDNLTYERLLYGEVDECEIASQGVASKANNLALWGVFEYYRDISPKRRVALHTEMMNNSLWQIATLTEDLLTNGMRIASFSPPRGSVAAKKIERWLKSWQFKDLKQPMKRTEFPLWQLKLRQTPVHMPMAIVIWCLILLYQTLLRRSDNKAISEWIDAE